MVQHFAYTGGAKNIAKWLELNPPAKLEAAKDEAASAAKPAAKSAKKAPAKAD